MGIGPGSTYSRPVLACSIWHGVGPSMVGGPKETIALAPSAITKLRIRHHPEIAGNLPTWVKQPPAPVTIRVVDSRSDSHLLQCLEQPLMSNPVTRWLEESSRIRGRGRRR